MLWRVLVVVFAIATKSCQTATTSRRHLRQKAVFARDAALEQMSTTQKVQLSIWQAVASLNSTWSSHVDGLFRLHSGISKEHAQLPHGGIPKEVAQPPKAVARPPRPMFNHYAQQAIFVFCCAFVISAYVLGFSLLVAWWRAHPLKGKNMERILGTPEMFDHMKSQGFVGDAKRRISTLQFDGKAISAIGNDTSNDLRSERVVEEDATEDEEEEEQDMKCLDSVESVWTKDDHIKIESRELIDAIGVAALCVFPGEHAVGVSKLPYRIAVPLVFLQAAGLQLVLLFYMWVQIAPRADSLHPLPFGLIFVAIYLHFLNCMQEIPYALQIFRYFVDFHDDLRDLLWFGFVLIADGFVIPALCFVLGALYLCTSVTIADIILNAVAVAFVREIDNWIIGFNLRANFLGGRTQSQIVQFPVGRKAMRMLSLFFVYFPVVPGCASITALWMGRTVLKL